MNKKQIINQTVEYVKSRLAGESSGHDWWHTYRVWKNAIYIAKQEKADLFIVELAALLHDIADYKMHDGNEDIGSQLSKEWLEKLGVDKEIIFHVCEIVKEISFKGSEVINKINSIEGMIVQDADRLDAIGAIGIGRVFAYGGAKGCEIYNPTIAPRKYKSFEQYKNNNSSSINHFYEKLLLLRDLMNTKTAKKIAKKRHKLMEKYLEAFFQEWNGKY